MPANKSDKSASHQDQTRSNSAWHVLQSYSQITRAVSLNQRTVKMTQVGLGHQQKEFSIQWANKTEHHFVAHRRRREAPVGLCKFLHIPKSNGVSATISRLAHPKLTEGGGGLRLAQMNMNEINGNIANYSSLIC